MLRSLFNMRIAVFLASAFFLATSLGGPPASAADFKVNKGKLSVVVQSEEGTRSVRYSRLSAKERRYVDQVLASLRSAGDNLPPLPAGKLQMSSRGTTSGLGCGVNSTNSEPVQVGCWMAGKVCYVSIGVEGIDGGCHDCNGTNCPTS